MRLARRAIITIFVFFLQFNFTLAENKIYDGDVRIISSDKSGITFTYQAPKAELLTPEGYSDNYKFPSMPRTAQNRKSGSPLLPVKIISVGVPFSSEPTVTIISQKYDRLGKVEVPNFISELSEKEFLAKATNQTPVKNWPAQTAFIGKDNVIRGLRILKINLAAAKVENGVLYKANTITVRVDFNDSNPSKRYSPRPNGVIFDNVLSHVVANYDLAKNWRVHWPPIPFQAQATQSVFDSASVWIKLKITSSGVYRISRYELSAIGIDVNDIDPQNFRMFYGGGDELYVDNYLPRPELVEIPIYVTDNNGDGEFDTEDLLLFYGESTDRYEYDPEEQEFIFELNHFTSRNVYWLTYEGSFVGSPRRWDNIDGSPLGQYDLAVDKYTNFIHQEHESMLRLLGSSIEFDNYFDWYWGKDSNFSASFQLYDVVAGSEARVKVKTGAYHTQQLYINNIEAVKTTQGGGFNYYTTTNLYSGTGFNSLYLTDTAPFHLDYIDIYYSRWLAVYDGYITFNSPDIEGSDSTNIVEYRLTNVPSEYFLLDVSRPDSITRIVDAELSGNELTFHRLNDVKREFHLVSTEAYKSISEYSIYEPDDLRSASNRADYIIITPEIFYDQAQQLAAHRESVSPWVTVKVVKVDDIYNQFSWGLFDPIAIRDFLKYAFENWSGAPPSYALLVGDGHYDFRNNLNSGAPIYIPPYESLSPTGATSSASDEPYIYFGRYNSLDSDDEDTDLDMIIGRLPVNNNDQMDIIVNKIINYEVNPVLGRWRNNVIIVADDHLLPGINNQTEHTRDAEILAGTRVPKTMEVQKIYLMEYPVRAGNTKPDAREALIHAFNEGGLIVNWIGHGNKSMWAHEYLFRRVEDMPRLNNINKLPMVMSASCSVALFDNPTDQCLSEDFVRYAGGGAIVSIGATRMVFATPNAALNKEMFNQLLFSDSVTYGAALYIAKYMRQNGTTHGNDRKFILFGDPGLVNAKPTLEVQFDYWPDSLTGLTVDSVAGTVCNDSGVVQSNFNGTVWVVAKDATIKRHRMLNDYNNNPINVYFDYTLPGATIFYGPAEVVNGQFSTKFFVPKDISYGGTGARIYVYFEDGNIDGSGVTDSLAISGGISPVIDSTGPTIDVFCNDRSLSSGLIAVSTDAIFEARLFDQHGINIIGSMGHGIEVMVDEGDVYSLNITNEFVFDMGDWQQGSAIFEINDLPIGEHTLTLKAWDNYNNSSLFTAYIQVYEDEQFFISEVMNYPNPVVRADSTEFQYLLSNNAENVSLKIFTLAGRKVRSFYLYSPEYISSGYNRLSYDLRDDDNDRLASGVYIYKIEAVGTGIDQKRRKSQFQSKLVILR